MAETLTQRIGRMGTGTAHAVALGGVTAVVFVVAGILTVLGVDTVEVTATLLVIPVFGVALFVGRQPGYAAAALATAAYMVLRRPDVGSAGVANLGLLVVTRAAAYAVVVYAGSWARQTLGEVAPGQAGAPADDRGLRQGSTPARSPVFVFDEAGVAETMPTGAPAPSSFDGRAAGGPTGPGPVTAPGFHAGSGQVPVVPAAAQAGPGGRNGNGRVPDDDWVDEPHPSDWLVGPAALPPDDPESAPWTGPVPLPGDDPAVTGGWGPVEAAPLGGPGDPRPGGADPSGPWGAPGAPRAPADDQAAWAAAPAGPLDLAGPPGPAGAAGADGPWGPPGSTWPPTATVPDGTGEWPAPAAGPETATYADDGYGAQPGYAADDGYVDDGYAEDDYDDGYDESPYEAGHAVSGPGAPGAPGADGWQAGVPSGAPGLTPSGRWDAVPPGEDVWAAPAPGSGTVAAVGHPGQAPGAPGGPWDQIVPPANGRASGVGPDVGALPGGPGGPGDPQAPAHDGLGAASGPAGPTGGISAGGSVLPGIPPIDPETRLWSARYLCDRLADEQLRADETGEAFSLVLVQVPDGPLAALSYRRQVTLLRELGHQFVAGGTIDHLVHVPDQTQHWFAVVLPGADKGEAQRFERRLRDGIGGYLRSRGLLLGELDSACLTSPDDDEAMGAIWDALIARGEAGPERQPAFGG